MIVGVPREVKSDEYRVAMLPVGAEELTAAGHTVLVEVGAGTGSGIADNLYEAAGATMVGEAASIWKSGRPDREGQGAAAVGVAPDAGKGRSCFTYFPLRRRRKADPRRHQQQGHGDRLRDDPRREGDAPPADADERGRRADERSGRGEVSSERPQRRARNLAGGRAGGRSGGGGGAGGRRSSARTRRGLAAGLGANVRILDINLDRLRYLDDIMPPNVTTIYSDRHTILEVHRTGRPRSSAQF